MLLWAKHLKASYHYHHHRHHHHHPYFAGRKPRLRQGPGASIRWWRSVSGGTRILTWSDSAAYPLLLPTLQLRFTWLISNRPGAGNPVSWILPFPLQQLTSNLVDQRSRGHACCNAESGRPPRCYASVGVRIILEITLPYNKQLEQLSLKTNKNDCWLLISCQYRHHIPHLIITIHLRCVSQCVMWACDSHGIWNNSKWFVIIVHLF